MMMDALVVAVDSFDLPHRAVVKPKKGIAAFSRPAPFPNRGPVLPSHADKAIPSARTAPVDLSYLGGPEESHLLWLVPQTAPPPLPPSPPLPADAVVEWNKYEGWKSRIGRVDAQLKKNKHMQVLSTSMRACSLKSWRWL